MSVTTTTPKSHYGGELILDVIYFGAEKRRKKSVIDYFCVVITRHMHNISSARTQTLPHKYDEKVRMELNGGG